MPTKKEQRNLLVLVRYLIKKDCPEKGLHKGDVVLYIRNDKGVYYYTTLRRNKAHSCTCPSRKRCYHIDMMVAQQNARFAASKPAQPIVSPEPTEYTMNEALAAKLASFAQQDEASSVVSPEPVKDNVVSIAERGNINGDQQRDMLSAPLTRNIGFSLLKVS